MKAFLCFCDEHTKVNVKLVHVHNEAQHREGTLGEWKGTSTHLVLGTR